LEKLGDSRFNAYHQYEPNLIGIGTQPSFAIGQRALFLRTPHGNVFWDCIAFLDSATVTMISALGGIQAIAISHPHFYTTMVEWSRAFGNATIHLHSADRDWVMRSDPAIKFWDGETFQLMPDITLVRGGGHFHGGTMLHFAKGAAGRGLVCSGDIATVTQDRKFLTFMRGYPNFIPLSARGARAVAGSLKPFQFDAMYGHYFDRVITSGAKKVLQTSVDRYVAAVEGAYDRK
jgi:hypothetical protein